MRQREWYGLRRVYSYSAKSELTFLISFRNDIGFIAPPAFLSLYCPSPSPLLPLPAHFLSRYSFIFSHCVKRPAACLSLLISFGLNWNSQTAFPLRFHAYFRIVCLLQDIFSTILERFIVSYPLQRGVHLRFSAFRIDLLPLFFFPFLLFIPLSHVTHSLLYQTFR